MQKTILVIFLPLFLLLFSVRVLFADSSYVLPYPGIMPGNKLYKVIEVLDVLKKYYAFGDFAQFKYNLSMSDKKLVEAKTLFEYNQFPLAIKALSVSDSYIIKIPSILSQAQKDGKNIQEKKSLLSQAVQKHLEILNIIKKNVPAEYVWQDEKKLPVKLMIHKQIDKSIQIREKYNE